ncbi:ATP-binding cassette domain-containing protein [Sphingomonas sp. MMS24-JH45]
MSYSSSIVPFRIFPMMPAPSGLALAFEGVRSVTATERWRVDGVDLAIAGGAFVALVGASGSGKSTLLKTVNRLVEPSAGRVTIDGADVAEGAAWRLRRRIGYVFQNVGLFPHLTVAENVALPLRIHGCAGRGAGARDAGVGRAARRAGWPHARRTVRRAARARGRRVP